MHYIIQENVFREQHYDLLQKSLDRLNLPYTTVRVFPFVDKIVDLKEIPDESFNVDELPDFNPQSDKVFVFGALKLARVATDRDWYPGSMMNKNHDFNVYKHHYKENLLNWDSEIKKLTEDLSWKEDEVKFIRPTQDTKSFTGKVFTEIEWKETLEHYLHNFKSKIFNENTEIQVSSPKNIQKEIRCWVVNGKIVTASQYRLGNSVIYDENVEDDAIEFAQRMVDIFQLAEAFVIDVCLSNGEWKIVECGCLNCAGFYKSNIPKMVAAIEEHFNFDDSFGLSIDGSKTLGY